VIGVSAAHALVRDGHDVVIYDRAGVAAGASGGNAGAFAFSDIIPLASPGMLRQAPRWLLDPLGPLAIRPAYALHALPWFLRFARASLPGPFAAARDAQAALMRLSATSLDHLLDAICGERLLRREGQLQIYDSAAELRAAKPGWDARAEAGIDFRILTSPDAIREIQPGLNPCIQTAVFTPDWINVTDPKAWVEHLAEDFTRRGGRIERKSVRALQPDGEGMAVATEDGRTPFERVLLATGAEANALLRPLGATVPLDTERGYNTTLPAGAFDLRTHLTFASHGFVVTRIGDGVRVGGAVEFAGLTAPPNMKRANAMLGKARRFLPDLDSAGGTQWMGFRPSMPDSLPVIGAAPGHPSLLLAFGHGHLGLTQSAGTADLIADLVAGRPPSIDMAPYRAGRFRKTAV